MKVYQFKQSQFIPADLNTVWDFFSSPKNLNAITPPEMNFEIVEITGGEKMYAGQMISYKVSPLPFVRLRWVTEIKHVEPKKHFTDDQKVGPFALWYHQHFFSQVGNGVVMRDEVTYAVPFGVLGRIANWMLVRKQLGNIFNYRTERIKSIFPLLPPC
jgi:ligand-binding SRPBCC domain-containing protein